MGLHIDYQLKHMVHRTHVIYTISLDLRNTPEIGEISIYPITYNTWGLHLYYMMHVE